MFCLLHFWEQYTQDIGVTHLSTMAQKPFLFFFREKGKVSTGWCKGSKGVSSDSPGQADPQGTAPHSKAGGRWV